MRNRVDRILCAIEMIGIATTIALSIVISPFILISTFGFGVALLINLSKE